MRKVGGFGKGNEAKGNEEVVLSGEENQEEKKEET